MVEELAMEMAKVLDSPPSMAYSRKLACSRKI